MVNRIIIFIFIGLICNLANAEEQSVNALSEKIEQYVLDQLTEQQQNGKIIVSADKIDNRLQLQACNENQLDVFNPHQKPLLGNITLGVRCHEETNRWTLYVPVKIAVMRQVLVADRPLTKGTVIKATDLSMQQLDVSQIKQGYLTDPDEVIGRLCKQTVNAGNPITVESVQKPVVIRKGEQVMINALSSALKVTMSGVALEDGQMNDVIRVKNNSSKRVIEAQVVAVQQVKIDL